jgi:gluconokinase
VTGRPVVVVMGVSGSGKSTVGALLAATMDRPFADADDLHTGAARAKMAAGVPLDDADRLPWLDLVGEWLAAHPAGVVSCSVLRRAYRDRIRGFAPDALFVHLEVSAATLQERMTARIGHFMPAALLQSQLATLEPLGADEVGRTVDGGQPPAAIVAEIRRTLAE